MNNRKKKTISFALIALLLGVLFVNTGNVSAYNNTWFEFEFSSVRNEARISGNVAKTDSESAVVSMYGHGHWVQGKELIALYINPTGKYQTMATSMIHVSYKGSYTLDYKSAFKKSGWRADLSGSLARSTSGYTWTAINGYWCP